MLGSFFWFKLLNFNIFDVYRKLLFLGDMKILCIFLGGHHKIRLYYLGFISLNFRVFLKVEVQTWGYFWLAKISNIFGVLEIPDIFGGEGWMLGPSLRLEKK